MNTTVSDSFPGRRDTRRSGRNFKQDDALFLIHDFVNCLKCNLMVGVLSDLLFEFFQSGLLMTVIRTDSVSWGAIGDTKNKPASLLFVEIGFIAQGRELSPQIIEVKVVFCFLKLHPFSLKWQSQEFVERLFYVLL